LIRSLETEKSLEEKKAEQLIKLREYKQVGKEVKDNIIIYRVKNQRTGRNATVWCILKEEAIGVKYVNMLQKMIKDEDLERGIIISYGRYTHVAQVSAKDSRIELISKDFPAFNIFSHILVPQQELLTAEEKEAVLQTYKVEAYKLPRIKTSDPTVKALGGKPGDVVKIIRNSPTAGKYVSYRYVVEG